MHTVAIICEYNPFHTGHKYQIDEIRHIFGIDTRIVAIMSGNFTQRGEVAFADKSVRAKMAVECGVNLVLELPFPFSMASAEPFAYAGVKIAEDLGVVDYLCFGSESADLPLLTKYADITASEAFLNEISKLEKDEKLRGVGYAKLCEITLNKILGDSLPRLDANDILAVEYIKAIKKLGSRIIPHPIKRCGAGYNEGKILSDGYQSATAIRKLLSSGDDSALYYIPKAANQFVLDAINLGQAPTSAERLSSAIISFFRLSSPMESNDTTMDAGGGLYNRLLANSRRTNDITTLVKLTETKKYTNARIRRAIWFSYLGVTSSDVFALPAYTQMLATDSLGRAILKEVRKQGTIQILTKPSKFTCLTDVALRQKQAADRADSIFQLTKPLPPCADYALTVTPYVKKQ